MLFTALFERKKPSFFKSKAHYGPLFFSYASLILVFCHLMWFKSAIFANYFCTNNVYCESVFTIYRHLFYRRKTTGLCSFTL